MKNKGGQRCLTHWTKDQDFCADAVLARRGGTYLSVDVLYMLAQIADNSDAIAENSKKQLLALSRLETLLQKTDAPGPSPESHRKPTDPKQH